MVSKVMEATIKHTIPLPEITEDDLDSLRKKHDRLRPIEQHAIEQVKRQIAIATVAQAFPEGKLLDLDVLRWRWSQPFRQLRANFFSVPVPKLALIHLGSPTFFLKRSERSVQDTSTMPKEVPEKCYGDILKQLDRATAFDKRYTLSHTWQGIIPSSASAIIDRAEEVFGYYGGYKHKPCVYLLAEAPFSTWSMESEPSPPPPRHLDPLIVGHKDNDLFVVGAFDPTPLEEYVSREFSV